MATLKTSINLAATKLAHSQNEGTVYVNGHIHAHGLCIYSQYQYYQVGFAASLLVQGSQENIYHFYHLSKSE